MKSLFRCNSTPPIATELVVLPKGFVTIGGKPCSVSKLNLVRGLPQLRFEKELACAPVDIANVID
jgi:hypothetical protein